MNTGEIYHIISVVCYILCALAFALTIFLFFRYRILDAVNILSGRKLKQDMDRLGHLSGSASESAPEGEPGRGGKKRRSRKKSDGADTGTEELYGLAQTAATGAGETEALDADTEDTGELYGTEEMEAPYKTEDTGELPPDDETGELDVMLTGASDTELL